MAEHCGTSAPISIPLATCTKQRELGTYTVNATVKNCFVNVTPVVTRISMKKTEKDMNYHVTFSINIAHFIYCIVNIILKY